MPPSLFILSLLSTAAIDAGKWEKLPPLPEPRGVASPFAGVSRGALIVAGGANFRDKMPWEGGKKVWHEEAWVLEKPGGEWRRAGKLPRPLAYGVSITMRDRLICVGGCDAGRHYAEVSQFSFAQGTVQQDEGPLPPLPLPLAYAAGAVSAAEKVYVACGSTEPGEKAASNRVFSLDYQVKAPAWQELPPLPAEARILPAAAAHGVGFYLFGGAALEEKDGRVSRRYLRDAWAYSDSGGWKRLADLPRPCVAAASPAPVVVAPDAKEPGGALIYLISGDDGTKVGAEPAQHPGFPPGILCYDTATNTWSEAGETPAPRATVPCVKWGDSFVLPSGEVRPGVRSPEVWSFTPDVNPK
jgi:N-acetylneuraminate epimerase